MLRYPAALLSPLTLALLLHGLPATAEDGQVEVPPAASEPEVRPAPPRPMLDSRSESHQQALQRQLPQRQQLMLDGGADPFLSLWLPANQAQPAGLVVLLHGEGETADWPTAIGPLRRQLPDLGWSTLSLSLPDAPHSGVQSRKTRPVTVVLEGVEKGEPEQASEAPDGEQAPAQLAEPVADALPERGAGAEPHQALLDELAPAEPDHERRLLARVRAALEHARQHNPRTLVLLGHGTGAYWAARFLHQEQPADVSQLVMVSAREPEAVATPLDELLPQLRLATGDFYYRDRPAQRQGARERLNASKRQEHPAYLQIGLPSLPSDARAEQEQLVRRVRGWLQLEPRAAQR